MRLISKILAIFLLSATSLLVIPNVNAGGVQGKYLANPSHPNPPFPFLQGSSKTQADEAWDVYRKNMGQPMSSWAKEEIRYKGDGTVFYPFSGPDFVTVSQLYPGATRYVMFAMQAACETA